MLLTIAVRRLGLAETLALCFPDRRDPICPVQSCKMNGTDPNAGAKQKLERTANRWSDKDIEVLVPWNFNPDD